MIMKANKQIGFIYKNEESIDKILKDGEVVFERGFLREKTSTTLPITFGGVGKDLKDYKVYGNTVQSKLPSGYTQVDYIESSGTQYIDTGVNADINLDIKIDMQYTDINASNNDTNFGAIYHEGSIYRRYHAVKNQGQFSWYVLSNANAIVSFDILRHTTYIKASERKIIFDEVEYTMSEITQTNPNINFWLFGRNSNDSALIFYNSSKLYSCKMYYNNVLVRDFIPCYRNSDNEVGLYDLANNVFYTNQGTGVFTYGSIAPTPDAPIEMVSCGDRTNNLFDKKSATYKNGYYKNDNGVEQTTQTSGYLTSYIKVKPNTAYTIQGLLKQINQSSQAYGIYYYNTNKEWISRATTTTNPPYTFTTPNECYFIQFQYRQDAYDEDTIQIEEGSTATPYEPYGYKIPVNVRSENLISQTIYQTNTNLSDNGEMVSNNNYFVMKQTNIKPFSNYKISENQTVEMTGANTTPIRVCAYDKNDNFLSLILKNVRTETKRYSDEFIIPENTSYILISFRNTDTNIELVESIDTNIYLDEPLRKIGDYVDYIDFINGKIVRQLGEVILNGSDDIVRNNTNTTGKYRFSLGITNINMITVAGAGDINPILSNKYISKNRNQTFANETGIGYGTGSTTYKNLIIYDEDLSSFTVEQFKTWLQSNNVTVDYILATPTEESITLPNIPTIDGNNTLNIETEITPSQVYIKYKSNT